MPFKKVRLSFLKQDCDLKRTKKAQNVLKGFNKSLYEDRNRVDRVCIDN